MDAKQARHTRTQVCPRGIEESLSWHFTTEQGTTQNGAIGAKKNSEAIAQFG